jgi:hypothetical protein
MTNFYQAPADESFISVRFKFGIHTIYVFVDPIGPVSDVDKELLSLLRERYPAGLTRSLDDPKTTPIPAASDSPKLAYGVLKIPNDPTRGWTQLKINDRDQNAGKCGLKHNGIVAFAFQSEDEDNAEFEVEWPRDDEELYEQSG